MPPQKVQLKQLSKRTISQATGDVTAPDELNLGDIYSQQENISDNKLDVQELPTAEEGLEIRFGVNIGPNTAGSGIRLYTKATDSILVYDKETIQGGYIESEMRGSMIELLCVRASTDPEGGLWKATYITGIWDVETT